MYGSLLMYGSHIRTDSLPPNLNTILSSLALHTSEDDWTIMANIAWSIWRCRNEKAYGGQMPTFERFKKLLHMVNLESRVAAASKGLHRVNQVGSYNPTNSLNVLYTCKVDGSWKPPWYGGFGLVLEKGNQLIGYRAGPSNVCCPIQAESVALREAVTFVKSLGISACTFLTDNNP